MPEYQAESPIAGNWPSLWAVSDGPNTSGEPQRSLRQCYLHVPVFCPSVYLKWTKKTGASPVSHRLVSRRFLLPRQGKSHVQSSDRTGGAALFTFQLRSGQPRRRPQLGFLGNAFSPGLTVKWRNQRCRYARTRSRCLTSFITRTRTDGTPSEPGKFGASRRANLKTQTAPSERTSRTSNRLKRTYGPYISGYGFPKLSRNMFSGLSGADGLTQLFGGGGRDRRIYFSPEDYEVAVDSQKYSDSVELLWEAPR